MLQQRQNVKDIDLQSGHRTSRTTVRYNASKVCHFHFETHLAENS